MTGETAPARSPYVVITAKWVLVLVAVILVILAAFNVKAGDVNLFFLGIAAFFASYLVP
jgi:uncharacterized integral membrane protein